MENKKGDARDGERVTREPEFTCPSCGRVMREWVCECEQGDAE